MPHPRESPPAEPGPPFELRISRGHAGLMAFAGIFIIFGGVLLGFVQLEASIPVGWRVATGLVTLYLAWVGATFIVGALRWLREPVFRITSEVLVSLEEREPVAIALGAIVSMERRQVRGTERTLIRWEGGQLEIPATLDGYEPAVAWMAAHIAERGTPAGEAR